MEQSIIDVIKHASFPPATAAKRFVNDLADGYIHNLTPGGRRFLAFIAHRFRRQYTLTLEQWQWVNEKNSEIVKGADA